MQMSFEFIYYKSHFSIPAVTVERRAMPPPPTSPTTRTPTGCVLRQCVDRQSSLYLGGMYSIISCPSLYIYFLFCHNFDFILGSLFGVVIDFLAVLRMQFWSHVLYWP